MTETVQGRDAIENQLQQLKVQLQQQGLNVERIEVSKHNDTNNAFQNQQQQKQSQEQHRSHQNGRGKNSKIDGLEGPMVLDQQVDVKSQQLMWNRRIPIGAALNIQA